MSNKDTKPKPANSTPNAVERRAEETSKTDNSVKQGLQASSGNSSNSTTVPSFDVERELAEKLAKTGISMIVARIQARKILATEQGKKGLEKVIQEVRKSSDLMSRKQDPPKETQPLEDRRSSSQSGEKSDNFQELETESELDRTSDERSEDSDTSDSARETQDSTQGIPMQGKATEENTKAASIRTAVPRTVGSKAIPDSWESYSDDDSAEDIGQYEVKKNTVQSYTDSKVQWNKYEQDVYTKRTRASRRMAAKYYHTKEGQEFLQNRRIQIGREPDPPEIVQQRIVVHQVQKQYDAHVLAYKLNLQSQKMTLKDKRKHKPIYRDSPHNNPLPVRTIVYSSKSEAIAIKRVLRKLRIRTKKVEYHQTQNFVYAGYHDHDPTPTRSYKIQSHDKLSFESSGDQYQRWTI